MIYLVGLVVVIALAVWLWGENIVKNAIKIILALLVLGIIFLIVDSQIRKNEKSKNGKASVSFYTSKNEFAHLKSFIKA